MNEYLISLSVVGTTTAQTMEQHSFIWKKMQQEGRSGINFQHACVRFLKTHKKNKHMYECQVLSRKHAKSRNERKRNEQSFEHFSLYIHALFITNLNKACFCCSINILYNNTLHKYFNKSIQILTRQLGVVFTSSSRCGIF